MARKRWAGTTAAERKAITAAGGRKRWEGAKADDPAKVGAKGGASSWADMTAKQRSEEMKRRIALRKTKKTAAS
jgi:hypothetical protein